MYFAAGPSNVIDNYEQRYNLTAFRCVAPSALPGKKKADHKL